MIQSDKQILTAMKLGRIRIAPFSRENLGPNSYDLTLHSLHSILPREEFRGGPLKRLDTTKRVPPSIEQNSTPNGEIVLLPETTTIVMSKEVIGVNQPFVGILSPRSGFSRLPISIGYSHLVDTGYLGVCGASITNHADYDLVLRENQRFMQIMFHKTGQVDQRYDVRKNSKYLTNDGSHVPVYKIDKEWL